MKGKGLYIIVGALVLLLALGGGVFYMLSQAGSDGSPRGIEEEELEEIEPEVIGFEYEIRDDNTGVLLTFNDLSEVDKIEYMATCTKEIEGEDGTFEGPGCRPSPSEIDVSDRDSFEIDIDFGSCSSGTCTYETIVSDELIIEVFPTFKDGVKKYFEVVAPFN